jgi:hypothetical protein
MKRITDIFKNKLEYIMSTKSTPTTSVPQTNVQVCPDIKNEVNIISINDIHTTDKQPLLAKSSPCVNVDTPHPACHAPPVQLSPTHITTPPTSLELYKNSNNDHIIDLEISYIIDSLIDETVTSYYNSNTPSLHSNMCDYYSNQLEYEEALESIISSSEIESVRRIVEGIIYKDNNFLMNLRSIKTYNADSMTKGLRCGVFKTSDLIIKIDISPEAFKCELFAMNFVGKGIVKPHNLVMPYIVKIYEFRKGRYMNFSIQPRITDSLTIYDWMKIRANKILPINNYATICINVCKSLLFLHSKHVVHGDIKPGNILIQNTTNIPFLIDFGLSGIHGVSEGTGGTKPFCHPATLNVNNDDEESYEWTKNHKNNDLWSIAFLFFTIMVFRNCYNLYTEYPGDFFDSDKYVSPKYFHHMPYHFRDAFQIILINPKHRINIKKLSVRKFIDLLEIGLHTNLTPFEI